MMKDETSEISRELVLKRLRRIEGQIRRLQKMIADERDCESIVTQLAAVRSAIDSAGALVLNDYMGLCFSKNDQGDEAPLRSLARVIAIWGRVKASDNK